MREKTGSRMPRADVKDLLQIPVPLPPLEEQKRIAAILNEQMAAVAKAKKASEERLEAAKALPAAYLREVFEGKKITEAVKRHVSDIAETTSGSTPLRSNPDYYGGTIPWVKTGELNDSSIANIEEFVTSKAIKECSLNVLPPGTVLVAMYGQGKTRGRTGLLLESAATNQACFAILPNGEVFNSEYLQMWLRYSYTYLRELSEGRGGNQPNLNGRILKEIEVPLPEIDFQNATVERFNFLAQSVSNLGESIRQELDTIEATPAALLRKAFAGEL